MRPLVVRPLLALYPLAMGLTLIATGEHYFFDVALGWLYAGAVMAGWAWWENRAASRRRPSGPPELVLEALDRVHRGRIDTPRPASSQRDQIAEHHRPELARRGDCRPPSRP